MLTVWSANYQCTVRVFFHPLTLLGSSSFIIFFLLKMIYFCSNKSLLKLQWGLLIVIMDNVISCSNWSWLTSPISTYWMYHHSMFTYCDHSVNIFTFSLSFPKWSHWPLFLLCSYFVLLCCFLFELNLFETDFWKMLNSKFVTNLAQHLFEWPYVQKKCV